MTLVAPGRPIKVPKVSRPAEADVKSAEAKLADLRRMRAIALSLLLLMTAIFVATSLAQAHWPALAYLRAFAEAGMVGACADWFAVVALFRRPFGLPIPHTGIVPNNKDRIGAALGRFITNNFLHPKVADEQLAKVDMVGRLARWIKDPDNSRQLAQYAGISLPHVLKSASQPELGEFLARVAQRGLESIPVAPLASRIVAVLWAGGAGRIAIERALDFAEHSLKRHKSAITDIVSEQSSRWIPKWVDRMIADRVLAGVLSTLEELRDEDHPWRVELAQTVEKLIADLATDPDMYAVGERLKADVLASPVFLEQAKSLWAEIERGLQLDMHARAEGAARAVEAGLQSFATWLSEEPDRQRRLNRRIRLLLLRMLLPRRAEIGGYVTRVVQNWDADTLVNRLELQVGKDLQYIRINGTLVGGLVGLLIFIASNWISGS
jgi:uncharacterized membrane-anchored protein YjiN (DUF445 family)